MTHATSFFITPLGHAELQNPLGELTQDQRQILLLVDGKRTIKEISTLISSNERLYLDEFFEYLLLAGFVSDAEPEPTKQPERAIFARTSTLKVLTPDRILLTESERRARMEQDLAVCKAQLAQGTESFNTLSEKYRRMKQQVLSYKQGMEAKVAAQQAELDSLLYQQQQSLAQRVRLETDLKQLQSEHEALQELMDKKSVRLEDAVKVRISKERLIGEEQQRQKAQAADEIMQNNPRYRKIRELDFFKNFNNLELAELVVWAEWRTAATDEVVLVEGDVGSAFYVVVGGKLVVQKGSQILTVLKPGMPFGEGFYLEYENLRRSASVIARTECELLQIDPVHLEGAEPGARMRIAEAFMRIQTKRLRAASQMLKNLLAHS